MQRERQILYFHIKSADIKVSTEMRGRPEERKLELELCLSMKEWIW
jgi:hypothetical protein